MEYKCIKRFESFKRSLNNLKKSVGHNVTEDFVLEGTICNYCLTFDLAWKVMKDILVKNMGIIDFPSGSPREVLKKANSVELIQDNTWLEMLNVRNSLTHDYNFILAEEKFTIITTRYITLFEEFEGISSKYMELDKLDTF